MWGYFCQNNSDFSHDLTGNEVEGLEQMERKLHLDIDEDPDRPGASYLLPDSLIGVCFVYFCSVYYWFRLLLFRLLLFRLLLLLYVSIYTKQE